MKRITIITAFLLVFVSAGAQRTFVVLSGVSNYGIDSANLRNTTKDVKEMNRIFEQQHATVSMLTSGNATHDNIVKKLNAVLQLADEKDIIIFFFSGHGGKEGFVAYGPEVFKYSELIDILSKAKTNNIFCFIDACLSGSVASLMGTTYPYGSSESRISFMMSSRADEISTENDWLGNGYFTQALMKGLRGKADTDGDKKITVSELFNYVYTDVTNRTRNDKNQQHPQLIGPKSSFNTVLTQW